ncbi:MAG TPA: histidine ammonia-lyase [Pyrinomonadaceae bacterium]|nr:histidine ammonia-lyase [Pyrinomonadaceae bacterium]
MREIILDGENLTVEQVVAVAYGKPDEPRVRLSEMAKAQVKRSANAVQKLLERGEIAYGITTGFGAFKDKIISREEVETLQRNIVVSHAVGVGRPFDIPTTRAIMLIRANTLARGFSGIKLETLELLLEFLNCGVHPVIPEKGSLGASGDLAPLAHMSLPLIGEGEAEFAGEILQSNDALKKANLKPITLAAKEGLALTNGTTIMTAVGLLETYKAKYLADVADVSGCLSLEALNGTTRAFDERIHALRPHPRQIHCAKNLREILEGSDFVREFDSANVQDAYCLRCMPQVHGACRDAIAYAEWVIDIELNAVTDNPLIFIKDEEKGRRGEEENSDASLNNSLSPNLPNSLSETSIEVLSGGNFHGEPLALAFDYLAIALSELGNISERRIMRLTDEASNARILPAFLTENGGLNSGFMLVQYTAAALCTENKILSHPASVDTIPSSANTEDHVSMGVTSVLKLRQVAENLELILSLELFSAAQAVDFRRRKIGAEKRLGNKTREVYNSIRKIVPFIERDVYMKPFIDAVHKIVTDRKINFD